MKALAVTTYTTGPITENCTVTAAFGPDTYTVTASAGTGGSISPSGATTVNYGGTPVFTVTPDLGYHITGVDGTCGGSLDGNTYTANSITGDCTVQASFQTYVNSGGYSLDLLSDKNGNLSQSYNITFLPQTYFIATAGTVREINYGLLGKNEILNKLINMQ